MTKLAAASSVVPSRLIKKVSTSPNNIIEMIASIIGPVNLSISGAIGSVVIFSVRAAAVFLIFDSFNCAQRSQTVSILCRREYDQVVYTTVVEIYARLPRWFQWPVLT